MHDCVYREFPLFDPSNTEGTKPAQASLILLTPEN